MGYTILAAVSLAGLLASVGCHLAGWLGADPPWGQALFVLHVGIFPLWFPLVFFANRTMPKGARGNLDHLLAELPRWARVAVGVLFLYALVNFAYFMWLVRQFPKKEVPFAVVLRGFSGHWMMFYGVAAAGFVALARLSRKRRAGSA